MPLYISFIQFTQKGREAIKDSPARLAQAEKAFEAHGGKLKHAWYTTGEHDIVVVTDFPTEEAFMKATMATSAPGFVKGQATRAYTVEEMKKFLGA